MIERLEVTPGPGTVIRYGSVAAWAASSASAGLISFLAVSARNLSGSPSGGSQLADHLVGVLESRDPEPHVPFAVVGPSEDGWAALLHGPVQVWDGTRWITPSPSPGWLRCSVWPQPSLAVSFAGASARPVSPDSLWDLEAGVVPGSGFILLPAVRTPTRVLPTPDRRGTEEGPGSGGEPEGATAMPVGTGSQPGALEQQVVGAGSERGTTGDEPSPVPGGVEPAEHGAGADYEVTIATAPVGEADVPEMVSSPSTVSPAAPESPEEPDRSPGGAGDADSDDTRLLVEPPGGTVVLRSADSRSRLVAYPPLPSGQVAVRPVPGSPVVAGVVCRQGHLNRPGMRSCVRCGSSITDQDAYNVSGTRPALGCLVLDDGSVYRLDTGYLVGSDPGRDPTVRGGLARPLGLSGTQLAASHAEIRLHDWDVMVTDRDSEGGTYLYGPDSTAWERLRAYEPRVLQPGTHMAFGQRVATFLTPWITAVRSDGPGEADPPQPADDAARTAGETDPAAPREGGGPFGFAQETRLRYWGQ